MDLQDRILELSRQGFFCAQIMLQLALESEGKENTDLIRSLGGLNGGIGNTGGICGALTGGACFISYFAGKGEEDELTHPAYFDMISELKAWFKGYVAEYGGCDCHTILDGDERNKIQRCPMIVLAVIEKCMELLELNGAL
ncbi:MAG: C_GCAxxG_C_C family protein [Ruminococcaceae bacterium]|nr:C_GCAxxG_C_C family protein [Oscillospiraceae bacterium]